MCYRKKKNQSRISFIGFVEEGTVLSRVVRIGLIGKMTSEQRLGCHEGVSHFRGKVFQAGNSTGVLRRECGSGELRVDEVRELTETQSC